MQSCGPPGIEFETNDLDPAICPLKAFYRTSSSILNGASKDSLSICEIRGNSNLSKYCLQIGSVFGFIQICVKTFKYVINCHRVRGDLIIR